MKLERLEICGFNHFVRPLVVEFDALPTGLVAVVGPNGAGKTTALDAAPACLYGPGAQNKAFPSRDGTLFQYATSSDAYIDTTWQLDQHGRVRCRVNVDGPRRKSDAVLTETGADAAPRIVNRDGLTGSYRDAVAARFPSQRSLLASAFAAQNKRGSFGELGQKDRLDLFSELADLSHLEDRARTAQRCQQVADGVVARLRTVLELLERDAVPLSDLEARVSAAVDALDAARRAVVVARATVADGERGCAALAADVERCAVAEARVSELTDAVARAAAVLDECVRASVRLEADADAARVQAEQRRRTGLAALDRRRGSIVDSHARSSADRKERIANNRTLLAQRAEILAAVERAETLRSQIAEHDTSLDAIGRDRDAARVELATCESALGLARAAARDLDAAKRVAGLLGTVKFGDDCGVDPACPLVTDAVAARSRMPELTRLAEDAPALAARASELRAAISAYCVASDGLTAERVIARRDLAALDKLVALRPHLDHADAKVAEYERDGVAADAAHAREIEEIAREAWLIDESFEREIAEVAERLRVDLDAAASRADDARETARSSSAALDAARAEVAALADVRTQAQRSTAALAAARAELMTLELAVASRDAAAADALRTFESARASVARAAETAARLRAAEDECLAWTTLARACGRDGLQRLEIDAAGPVVSDLANQLLEVGYGARFQVRIVTQVETADRKDMKERFTILVLDQSHGGEARDIGDLSGGERVVVEEAIRAALSCYVALRSREPVRTIFRDETTGALDPENAPKYVAMLRKLQQISGAEHVLFITHSPACAALADAQIRVLAGEATVALPPYDDAAA